jgi:hypothetical protein
LAIVIAVIAAPEHFGRRHTRVRLPTELLLLLHFFRAWRLPWLLLQAVERAIAQSRILKRHCDVRKPTSNRSKKGEFWKKDEKTTKMRHSQPFTKY